MSEPDSPELRVMSASEVRQHFGDVVNRVARGECRVIVEKHGAPAVGLVSMDDIRRLRSQDELFERRASLVERVRAHFDDVPDAELEREIEQAFDEMRQERRHHRAVATKAAS
ncbi:MAG: type II toxin-antitoxin system Phd/YefM family antitoxin [Chloroflexia bacterium]|nr:type II toxin-antitoxin system Phd/YefM family antitoxin [Chloroflexia bacterium]